MDENMRPSKIHGASEELVVPLAEEKTRVEKRITSGRVRIRTVVDEIEENANATLKGESVEIIRVPVDRQVNEIPEIRTENGVTIVPIVEEVLLVETRLVLKEELHIHRHATTQAVEVPVTLQKQRAIVERVAEATHTTESKE